MAEGKNPTLEVDVKLNLSNNKGVNQQLAQTLSSSVAAAMKISAAEVKKFRN